MKISLREVLLATFGTTSFTGKAEFTGVTTDSRSVKLGDLFVALKGDKFDGHAFVAKAAAGGAAGVMVSQAVEAPKGVVVIRVEDTLRAYQDLARSYRMGIKNLIVVAVTGSNGKTSTKDMIAACLSTKFKVVKTQANFNNEIGLPKTLLSLEEDTQVAVVEIGMRALGQIKAMCAIASPQIAVITNVGDTHIGELGSIENIAQAKSEILEDLPRENGFAVLNGDQQLVRDMVTKLHTKASWFGLGAQNDYRGDDVLVDADGTEFTCIEKVTGDFASFKLQQIGEHNVMNALAAIAVGRHLGVKLNDMVKALADYETTGKRQEILHFGTYTVINDAYNASPASMEAALKTLHELKKHVPGGHGRSLAVLADMLELGEISADAHRKVGEIAVREKTDIVLTYGTEAVFISEEIARLGGKTKTYICIDKEDAAINLKRMLKENDVILLKGSHSMQVDDLVGLVFKEHLGAGAK
jgi:UDP-N-acetylmuramoyl-tripeptide--D-alanyl-D-alanine ligase